MPKIKIVSDSGKEYQYEYKYKPLWLSPVVHSKLKKMSVDKRVTMTKLIDEFIEKEESR
jgi:uncharacterized hydantoinase/oxoprolinase family protein